MGGEPHRSEDPRAVMMESEMKQEHTIPPALGAIATLLQSLTGIPFLRLFQLAALIWIGFGSSDDYQAPKESKTPALPQYEQFEPLPEIPSYSYPDPEPTRERG